jgi:hypothetical protein
MGLDTLGSDSNIPTDGNSWLVVDPQGGLNFGINDVQSSSAAVDTVTLTAKGQEQVVIIDIRLGDTTWSTFSLSSGDLPLPHLLPSGVDYPVDVEFLPVAAAEYDGTLEIDTENESNGVDTTVIELVGCGCDSQSGPGCPPANTPCSIN